jgi:hypothetical protein
MNDAGYLKGPCQNCGGRLEFPAAGIGTTVDCPHCGGQTILGADPVGPATPAGELPARSKRGIPVALVSVVLILVLATAGMALYRINKTGAGQPASTLSPPPIAAKTGIPKMPASATEGGDLLQAGPVTLQTTEGSALVYAVGTIRNNSDQQRFGIKIEVDLLDERDQNIGTAGDYLAILEPHKDWQFRALLTQPRAVAAKVSKIEEQK